MGTLRIVAGRLRGRRVPVPPGINVRPTSDRVREALFNILGQALDGEAVLDLYAGTGACGLEAISRGAARAVFVESDPRVAAAIRKAAAAFGVEREARIVIGRVEDVLDRERLSGPFDVVFADPPYAAGTAVDLPGRITASGLLAPAGTLVVERDAGGTPGSGSTALSLRRTVSYGRTSLDFYGFP